jgi:aryl-alcohol dehydrogenase-like predicted oxidoreductase
LNVFNDNAAMLDLCREQDLASLNRVPLLMSMLTGRWSAETKLEESDPRAKWFEHDEFLRLLDCAQRIQPYLIGEGRSAVQGALGWIWARSPLAVPLPDFRDMAQMQELVQALEFDPLPPDAMQAITDQLHSAGFASHG